jgi:hypothetical protein
MNTLANAVAAAIAHGNTLADIRPAAWAATYGVDTETVRAEFERQMAQVAA